MIDEYGFGSAALATLFLFDLEQRRSGRSSRMIERAQAGDVVVVASPHEMRRLEALLRAIGKTDVRLFVSEHGEFPQGLAGRRIAGRVIFDHDWLRKHFERAIRHAEGALDAWSLRLSEKLPPAQSSGELGPLADWRMRNLE